MPRLEHLECVCDFCGNFRNPGHAADVLSYGDEKILVLSGNWEFYDSRLTFSKVFETAYDVTNIELEELQNRFDGPMKDIVDFVLSLETAVIPIQV